MLPADGVVTGDMAVFAHARDAEAIAEERLVDDDWKLVEIEPEVTEAHRNGTNGNGAIANDSLHRSPIRVEDKTG